MLEIEYLGSCGGWQKPRIVPFHDIILHPAAKIFHYCIEVSGKKNSVESIVSVMPKLAGQESSYSKTVLHPDVIIGNKIYRLKTSLVT